MRVLRELEQKVTPQHVAARQGDVDALKALHAGGVDLTAWNGLGRAPAGLAAQHNHADALRALHALRVDLALPDGNGHAPGHHAAEHGAIDALTSLHSLDVDLDAPDAWGNRPMHAAAAKGQVASLDKLCELGWGVDLNAANHEGHTPANLAARHGHTEFLQRLREHGVDLSQSPAEGMAPAQVAAEHDQIDTLATMIRWGVAMPQTWPPHLAETGPQRVNQAAVAAAIAELDAGGGMEHTNLASDLTCPVSAAAFGTEGPHRPVRWTDGATSIVMSASVATEILRGTTPKHPLSRQLVSPEDCVGVVESPAFRDGDAQRLAQVRAVRDEMLAGGPEQGRLDRLVQAVKAAEASVPQWQRVLDADQQRVAAGADAAPARAAQCVIS